MPLPSRRRVCRGSFAVLFILAALFAVPALANAATVTVNTTADNAPGPGQCEGVAGDCSLRQAIDVANGEPGATTIVVPAGQYDLTIEPTSGTPNDSGNLSVEGDVTIEGAGARKTIVDASAIEDQVLEVAEGDVHLVGLGVTGGTIEGDGGGIYVEEEADLTLEGVAVTDNESFNIAGGGGIDVEEEADLTIRNSVVSGNRTSGDGGGIDFEGEDLTIEDSTIADNLVETALYPGNPEYGAFGGAMEAYGRLLVMKNVTIAGNHIVDNNGGTSLRGGGAAMESEFETYEVANTIIADNTAESVEEFGQCTEEAPMPSLGHNLETAEPAGEPRCFAGPTDLIADPLLGALADNGGETDTMAIPANSPAVDAGNSALCLPTDQRGVARPVGSGCDIGAFEFQPETKPPVTPAAPKAAPAGGWFGIKDLKKDTKKGTIELGVAFEGTGEVTVTGNGVTSVTRKVSSGKVYLPLVPKGKMKSRLMETGKAKATVAISFQTAGNVWKKDKTVVFRLK